MQLYSVQLIPGKAEITGDKSMHPSASGSPQTPTLFQELIRCISKHSVLNLLWTLEFQLNF